MGQVKFAQRYRAHFVVLVSDYRVAYFNDADGKIFKKYVCMGKELEKIEGSTILNEVRKANGFDVSEMQ